MKQDTMNSATAALIGALLLLGSAQAQQQAPRRPAAPAANKAQAADPARSAIEKKLDAIVIPAIEFKNTSIEEAIDFLRQQSRTLDKSTTDEAQKGLNFMLRAPRGFQLGRVTLSLKNVTLRKALENVAESTGTQVQVDSLAITLVPKSEAAEPAPRTPKPGDATTLDEAAKKITIPVIEFENTSLKEAVEFLNQQIKEQSGGKPTFTVSIDGDKVDATTRIAELRLRNVPVDAALGYLTQVTRTTLVTGEKEMKITRP